VVALFLCILRTCNESILEF